MRVAIFGCGLMGSAIARDIASSNRVEEVWVFDVNRKSLDLLTKNDPSGKVSIKTHDVRERAKTVKALKKFDVGVGALPHGLSEYAVDSAVRAGVNFVDLIYGWRLRKSKIHSAAKGKEITIIPACGLAPGLSNILAMAAIDQMEKVDEVHIKVGGIPEKPKPPLNYRIVFSFDAVLEEYQRKAKIIRNGRLTEVEALSGVESVGFPLPIGECECFYTDGLSTLLQTVKGVREMDEKTIRWPGHVQQIRTLIECGLLGTEPVQFNREKITPRAFVSKILSEKLRLGKERDLTLLRVDVSGKVGNSRVHHRYEMIDRYDQKLKMTSMARTTAYPCSVAVQMLGEGVIGKHGLVPPELAIRGQLSRSFMQRLAERGLKITSTHKVQASN